MNENLNLVEILKDCPEGTEFYHAGYGRVWFYCIDLNLSCPIRLSLSDEIFDHFGVTSKGTINKDYNGECLLFPSKEQRDWSKFTAPWLKNERDTIDCLEKQCEPNPYSGVSFKYNGHTWGMCARYNGVEILVDGEIKERIFLDNKPQGKSALEAIKEEKVDNELAKRLCSEYAQKLYNPSNTGKNEQKSADKIEPKFKVGNWYQCTKDFFGKGVTFDKNTSYYCAQEGCLQDEYGCHIAIVKDLYDNFKLWTIQDAKKGDVLEFGDRGRLVVGIVSYINKSTGKVCWLENNRLKSRNYYDLDTINPHPASREKRDALMKAMADAGYEWDAEKKELKYILTDFEDAIKDMMNDYRDAINDNKATAEEVKERSKYLLALIPYKQTDWCKNEI